MNTIEQLKLDGQLPSPKGVALTVISLCRRDEVTVAEVACALQPDPALTGLLIMMANTAARGGRPTASISDAVVRLGFATVKRLVLGFSLLDNYRRGPCKAFDYQAYWSRSLLMAITMQTFARAARAGVSDELFACGLLAQVGRLALATVHPQGYQAVLESHQQDPSRDLVAIERQHLAVDHNELSAAMLVDWGIPKVLAESVLHHEDPEAAGYSPDSRSHHLVHLLHMAARLADLGMATEQERPALAQAVLDLGGKISLEPEAMASWIDGVMREWREWAQVLKVPASALPPFAELATAQEAPSASAEPPLRILVVDGDAKNRRLLEEWLGETAAHTVHTASNGKQALAMALEVLPQLIITDWDMPEMSGIEFCQTLRASDLGRRIYILMLTHLADEGSMVQAFEAGVDEYAVKPVSQRGLAARLRAAYRRVALQQEWEHDRAQMRHIAAELAIANRRLEHTALTDLLTGLPNRRAAMDRLQEAWSAATRSGQPLSVMVIDLDHFKRVNDTYGHAAGDAVLKGAALALRGSARRSDSVCRIGGEEFLIICQDATPEAAYQSAERLRTTLADSPIQAGDLTIPLTLSIGVACKEEHLLDMDALVRAADKALYSAKHAGRNRTCLALRRPPVAAEKA